MIGSKNPNSLYDSILVGTDQGRIYILTKLTGKFEKFFEAHTGAVLALKWDRDHVCFASSGEDGTIKIWSRSCMLRATIANNKSPIYSFAWGHLNSSIVCTDALNLTIKPIQTSRSSISWRAHKELVLAVDWSLTSEKIISGAEDCKYKVWTEEGNLVYSSGTFSFPINSIAWAANGQHFAVGLFEMVMLCDRMGVSQCDSQLSSKTGSVYALKWSGDSSTLLCGTGSGNIFTGYIFDKVASFGSVEAKLADQHRVLVSNPETGLENQSVEWRERITNISVNSDHLILLTISQCCIFKMKSLLSPITIELRDNDYLVIQSEKYFMLVSLGSLEVYTYDGRLVMRPKQLQLKSSLLDPKLMTLNSEFLAIRDAEETNGNYSIINFDVVQSFTSWRLAQEKT
ncbi:Intraflagellar transport protein 80 [Cichlidogyrus casuarinus]|uniref:Intraflagellar transport protein 80 n=1 Tax=Cichlidogyrus casuarinus TaxID=1844966 RepID=A0ABD2QHE9_9PLAT